MLPSRRSITRSLGWASEQDRPDIARARRRAWWRRQASFDPARLIFLDESGAKTNMTRLRGRAPRARRVHASAPHGHWCTTTMISSIRLDGSTACMTLGGATDTEAVPRLCREGPLSHPASRRSREHGQPLSQQERADPTLALIEQAGPGHSFCFAPSHRRPDQHHAPGCHQLV